MSGGVVVPVLPKTRFEYSYLAPSASQQVILQPALDVGEYYYFQLIVRIHERSFSGSQTIVLQLFNTLPSEEDSREFTSTSAFTPITITGVLPSAVPGLLSSSGTDPGGFLKLLLTANQQAGSSGTLYAELSAVLVLRQA